MGPACATPSASRCTLTCRNGGPFTPTVGRCRCRCRSRSAAMLAADTCKGRAHRFVRSSMISCSPALLTACGTA